MSKINPIFLQKQSRYPLNVLLGLLLRCHREANALTQEQVADSAGCHVSYLSLIENGRSELSIKIFDRLCKAMQVSAPRIYSQAEYLEIQFLHTHFANDSNHNGINPSIAQGWFHEYMGASMIADHDNHENYI
ncbi:MAG: helix-turn-helix transcriptional regulator [Eubacteriales bacterium]|nr:helix-turn-helix transcriptional regulator [Eubacteriales bacterium]